MGFKSMTTNVECITLNSQLKFKNTLLKSSFCDYSDAYTLAKDTIKVANTAVAGAAVNNRDVKIVPHLLNA